MALYGYRYVCASSDNDDGLSGHQGVVMQLFLQPLFVEGEWGLWVEQE